MSKEQVISTLNQIENQVKGILDDSSLFLEEAPKIKNAEEIWINKISELKNMVSDLPGIDGALYDAGLTDEFLKFKINIINFLSLRKLAKRLLDCIIIFLSSLASAISNTTVKMIIEILKEFLGFIKNLLK